MDEHIGTMLEIAAGLIALVYGGVLVWVIKRLLRLEDEMKDDVHTVVTGLAVMERGQIDLREGWQRAEKRNATAHEQIIKRIDSNHGVVMKRLDTVIDVVKNGG